MFLNSILLNFANFYPSIGCSNEFCEICASWTEAGKTEIGTEKLEQSDVRTPTCGRPEDGFSESLLSDLWRTSGPMTADVRNCILFVSFHFCRFINFTLADLCIYVYCRYKLSFLVSFTSQNSPTSDDGLRISLTNQNRA